MTKNKKSIFEKKSKKNKISNLISNSKIRNTFNLDKYNKNSENRFDKIILNNQNYNYTSNRKYSCTKLDNEIDINLSDKENYDQNCNQFYSYENQKVKRFNKDSNRTNKLQNNNYIKINNNQNTIKKINYNNDKNYFDINNNYENENKDKSKFNKLLSELNVKNINDAIYRVEKLLKFEKDINKLKDLYYENKESEKMNLDNNLIWLTNIIKKYKKYEVYRN